MTVKITVKMPGGGIVLPFMPPNAKSTDPRTSHDAADFAKLHASEGRLLALQSLRDNGPQTDYELEASTGWQQNSIGKRRLECQQVGLVRHYLYGGFKQRRFNKSGARSYVWEITDAGKTFLASHGY